MLGTWAARRVGLLDRNAPSGETLGVGLGAGLLLFAAWWATVGSAGRSAFTPVAIAFALALVLTRFRGPGRPEASGGNSRPRFSRFGAAIAAGAFVIGIGLIFGSTQAPSPRDGLQPVEFTDVGYYSALAINLNRNGSESLTYPSGFESIDGLPPQAWYHWGEIWIAAATIRLFDLDPIQARNYAVLPLLLLAIAALTGTIVRRTTGASSRWAYMFGVVASLFLAPITVQSDVFFAHWAVGNVFGVGLYGLSMVAVLLALYLIANGRTRSPALALFSGAVIASLLPTHIVMAGLAADGVGGVFLLSAARTILHGSRPTLPAAWRGMLGAAASVSVATGAWGFLTGHGLGGSASSTLVSSFNPSWFSAIAQTAALAGAFLAIPVAWFMTRQQAGYVPAVLASTVVIVVFGALAWGARLGDYNMFHVYFGAIAVFATPAAALAVWTVWMHLRKAGRLRLAMGLLSLCIVQIELGISPTIIRLEGARPSGYDPIPVAALDVIKLLPTDAKLAYACETDEEFVFSDPRLSSIYAHTGRRVVPMCFEEDILSTLNGGKPYVGIENPTFKIAPQRVLFPNAATYPSPRAVSDFLKRYSIEYIYADARHPNSLVPDAVPIATLGEVTILQIR